MIAPRSQETVKIEHCKDLKKAIESACRMLSIREHSKKQLVLKLLKKGFSQDVIEPCLQYVISENWLCEKRFCNSYIRSKANKGLGALRITQELKQQNIDQTVIDTEFKNEAVDWQALCKKHLLKKIRIISSTKSYSMNSPVTDIGKKDENFRLKLENFLRYRGFSNEEIQIAMNQSFAN